MTLQRELFAAGRGGLARTTRALAGSSATKLERWERYIFTRCWGGSKRLRLAAARGTGGSADTAARKCSPTILPEEQPTMFQSM